MSYRVDTPRADARMDGRTHRRRHRQMQAPKILEDQNWPEEINKIINRHLVLNVTIWSLCIITRKSTQYSPTYIGSERRCGPQWPFLRPNWVFRKNDQARAHLETKGFHIRHFYWVHILYTSNDLEKMLHVEPVETFLQNRRKPVFGSYSGQGHGPEAYILHLSKSKSSTTKLCIRDQNGPKIWHGTHILNTLLKVVPMTLKTKFHLNPAKTLAKIVLLIYSG